ncbi:MAG TPA: AsmA family protein [Candidatus Sulfopaludibacter sp.]|jgi:AsmA protein|nr:AsmA family protein [Candidatus Sulfopaludibacter sp.]
MKRIAKWVGIALALLLVVAISLPFLINVNQFKPTLESSLSEALGREVHLGNLKLSILSGEVSADDLSVSDDPHFGKPAFVKAHSFKVGVEILPFILSRKLNVREVTLDQPEIVLVQAPSGDWNFSSLGGKAAKAAAPPTTAPQKAALDLSVQLIRITNGRLTLGRTLGHWKPLVLEQVNIEVKNFAANAAFPFSLSTNIAGGGSLKLDGQAGPYNQDDAAMTPISVSLHMNQLDLVRTGMNDAAPDIAGLVSFDANGNSDGREMHLKGTLKGEKMKLAKNGTAAARPLELDFAVDHNLRKHSGAIRQGDIHIGGAKASLTGTYAEQGEAMEVNLKLNGPNMPVQELAALLPALGVVLPLGSTLQGGTASALLTVEGPADRLVSGGSLAVKDTKLVGFNLSKRMGTIEKLAGIQSGNDAEIQELSANVRVTPEGTAAQEIKLILPAVGELSGGGTVSPANALDFKMTAAIHNTPIPFTVQGTAAEPVFRPDIKAAAKEELKSVGGSLLKGLFGKQKK